MMHDSGKVQRVAEMIKEHNVQFINLQFTDMMGVPKMVGTPIWTWDDILEHGMWFDGSSVEGFARIAESDMLLHPDLDTFAVVPWDTDVPTARVICDAYMPNGQPFEGDPRRVLKRALAEAKKLGYDYFTGPELEFFLFKPHADGSLFPLEPHDQASYFDVSTDLAHSVRRQMVTALAKFGIQVEALHHEVAIGQHEIDFRYDHALQTADNAVTLRMTLKAIAQRNGLYCTFMPKPVKGINGSGMHTHQSLWQDGKNAFADTNDEYGLTMLAKKYIAGQLAHAREMSAVIAPLVNSYKRLVPGYEAPVYISWAHSNRSALSRIPQVSPSRLGSATRIELRCPDPSANPYLAFAVMLMAGLDGIQSDLPVPTPTEENLYHLDEAGQAKLTTMPGSLGEAIAEMSRSELVERTLGKDLFARYIEGRKADWDEYRINVSQWELDRYLPIY